MTNHSACATQASITRLATVLLTLCAVIGSPAQDSCQAARRIKVEQAGDRFVNFVLDEIEATRKTLPAITRAAELAADRIVELDGELLSAGDQSFSLEPVWRAGGIGFSRQYTPEGTTAGFNKIDSPKDKVPYYRTPEFVKHFTVKKATSRDVVLLGYENEKEERRHLLPTVKQLMADKALVIFFGSRTSAERLKREFGKRDNLLAITHDVPDGGIIKIKGRREKVCRETRGCSRSSAKATRTILNSTRSSRRTMWRCSSDTTGIPRDWRRPSTPPAGSRSSASRLSRNSLPSPRCTARSAS